MKKWMGLLLAVVLLVGTIPATSVSVFATPAEEAAVEKLTPAEETVAEALASVEAPVEPTEEPSADALIDVEIAPETQTLVNATSGVYTYTLDGYNKVSITKYTGTAESLSIPATIDGYPVAVIGSNAFANCTSLKTVVIPDSVTRIGDLAFNGCTFLKNVTLSKGLTYLGGRAFSHTAIEAIEIPKSLDEAGSYSYYDYPMDGKTYTIYGGPFYYCDNLKTVTFETGVTEISKCLFRGCTGLETITIPDTVTEIEEYAFQGCFRLKNVAMGDAVERIENHAFDECYFLETVNLSKALTYLGGRAFSHTKSFFQVI